MKTPISAYMQFSGLGFFENIDHDLIDFHLDLMIQLIKISHAETDSEFEMHLCKIVTVTESFFNVKMTPKEKIKMFRALIIETKSDAGSKNKKWAIDYLLDARFLDCRKYKVKHVRPHICKYCGVITTQPDDQCYKAPKK